VFEKVWAIEPILDKLVDATEFYREKVKSLV
jgi:hypothetical protein